jgi:hypothetical protein
MNNYLIQSLVGVYIAVAATCGIYAAANWERPLTLATAQQAMPGAFDENFGSRLPTCNTPEAKPGRLCKVAK